MVQSIPDIGDALVGRLTIAHLLDDTSLGGVVKGLSVFHHPILADLASNHIMKVNPDTGPAPWVGADVIISHFPVRWRMLPFLAALKMRNPQSTFVHVEHHYSEAWEQETVENRLRFRTMLRLALRFYDHVVCVSHAQARWLTRAAWLGRRSPCVIYPWSDEDRLLRLPAASPRTGEVRLAAYGRYARAKGFDVLIEAVRLLNDSKITLKLAGYGPEQQYLESLASGCPQIEIGGPISDIGAFLTNADAVVVPSRWEPFGQVATEAKLAGRMLVTSLADGLPEQVGKGGITADCSRPDRLADAIHTLRSAPLAEIGLLGRDEAKDAGLVRALHWRRLLRSVHEARALPQPFVQPVVMQP